MRVDVGCAVQCDIGSTAQGVPAQISRHFAQGKAAVRGQGQLQLYIGAAAQTLGQLNCACAKGGQKPSGVRRLEHQIARDRTIQPGPSRKGKAAAFGVQSRRDWAHVTVQKLVEPRDIGLNRHAVARWPQRRVDHRVACTLGPIEGQINAFVSDQIGPFGIVNQGRVGDVQPLDGQGARCACGCGRCRFNLCIAAAIAELPACAPVLAVLQPDRRALGFDVGDLDFAADERQRIDANCRVCGGQHRAILGP